MLNLKRWSALTLTAAIAAVFALAFPPAEPTSAEAPPAESASTPALSSDDSVRDVADGSSAASGGTAEVMCVAGGDCEDEDFEWAAKKIRKKCGSNGGYAFITCTDSSVEIDGDIECFE